MKKIFILAMAAAVGAAPPILADSETYTLSFDRSKLVLTEVSAEGSTYLVASYDGLSENGEPGQPALPYDFSTLSLPTDAGTPRVSVTTGGMVVIDLEHPLFPVQEPVPTDGSVTPKFTAPMASVYRSNAAFPMEISAVVSDGYLDGHHRLTGVAVCPFQYRPLDGKLLMATDVTVTVDYECGSAPAGMRPLWRADEGDNRATVDLISRMVRNPARVPAHATFKPEIIVTDKVGTLVPVSKISGFEYTIITTEEFAPAFERLVALRRQLGLKAGIVHIEDILKDALFARGDTLTGVNDDAGKLRAYLTDAYQKFGTKYVLLGGTGSNVPFRYGYSIWGRYEEDHYVPSDLYFSELNSNWDMNKNDKYGEVLDEISSHPDIFVGRLLCKNKEHIHNYIDKVVKYELNPGNGDREYFKRRFSTYSHEFLHEGNVLKNDFDKLYSDSCVVRHLAPKKEFVITGREVVEKMNNNTCIFLDFHNHGSPEGIGISNYYEDWDRVYSLKARNGISTDGIKEDGNGLDCLKNSISPNVVYSICCTVTPFDTYRKYDIEYNMGESFTLGKNYGGVAFLGNTRVGLYRSFKGTHIVKNDLRSAFLEMCFLKRIQEGCYSIGEAEDLSKMDYSVQRGSFKEHIQLVHNLIGDPALYLWNIKTKKQSVVNIRRGTNNMQLYTTSYSPSTFVVCPIGGTPKKYEYTGTAIEISNPPANCSVISTSPGMLPAISRMYIQKQVFFASGFTFGTTIKIGNHVDTSASREKGDVLFNKGSKYKFEALNHIFIGEGTRVGGGTLRLYCPKTIEIEKLEVSNGGKVSIYCDDVRIGELEIDNTSKFNIYRYEERQYEDEADDPAGGILVIPPGAICGGLL